jgi:calcineurin-like phosphoesterase family protein
MIFFTSDHHFGHANVIKYSKRPFANVEAMDTALVEHWNAVVGKDDTVYHLGDFTLGDVLAFERYAQQLNGWIKIVPGGHDYRWVPDFLAEYKSRAWLHKIDVLPPLYTLELPEYGTKEDAKGRKYPLVIALCHYSMQVWDRSHYGAYHLFGHSHGNLMGIGNSFDVGVDCWEFTPVSLPTILTKFSLMARIAAAT